MILQILAALGLTAIIVEGRIFRMWPFSFIKALIPGNDCFQCTGFWAGIAISFMGYKSFEDSVSLGLGTSFLAYIIKTLLDNLENEFYEDDNQN